MTLTFDKGLIRILDSDIQQLSIEQLTKISVVNPQKGFYDKLTLYHNLSIYGELHHIPKSRINELLQKVGLSQHQKIPVDKLSPSLRQRMLILQAIIKQPQILFLDEPTLGVDISTSRLIHQLLLDLREKGTTIFLTTSDTAEARSLCDHVALLHKGQIVETGQPSALIQKYNSDKKVRITYLSGHQEILSFNELSSAIEVEEHTIEIASIHSCEPTLEDIFISLTGGPLNA